MKQYTHFVVAMFGAVGCINCTPTPKAGPENAQTTSTATPTGVATSAGGQEEQAMAKRPPVAERFAKDMKLAGPERSKIEAKIMAAFGKLNTIQVVKTAVCRKTLCRLVVRAQSGDDLSLAMHQLAGSPYGRKYAGGQPLLVEGASIRDRVKGVDGSVTATIYIHRNSEQTAETEALLRKRGLMK